jgi:hypothetical protein
MAHWIQQLQQERQKESQRQAYFTEVFPARAGELWERLCATLSADLDELQQAFPHYFPSAPGTEERDHWFMVKRSSCFPFSSYQLELTLDVPGQKIYVEQYLRISEDSRPKVVKTGVLLSLDSRREKAQLSLNGEILSPEQFSEWCLRPFVDPQQMSY